MSVEYRFNGGRGAVLCRECLVIIDADLSYDEAVEMYDNKDICWKCKGKPNKEESDDA